MKNNFHPPLGQLVDIGSHRLHLYEMGEGCPTVVLESGGLSWCLDWYPVQTEIAKFTRVCSYDRAGFGWSDPGPKPRTSAQIVAELHTLLKKAELKPPYILVGASFGGHNTRLYAQKYPNEVAGMILLDARHEAHSSKMPPAWKKYEQNGANILRGMLLASRIGAINRIGMLLGNKAAPVIVKQLLPELRQVYLDVGFQPKFFQANLDEFAAIAESDQQLRTTDSLGDIPLTVIRHGIPNMFKGMPDAQVRHTEQVWQELQLDLANLSSNSRLLIAENSGHNIAIDQPELVVKLINEMFQKVLIQINEVTQYA